MKYLKMLALAAVAAGALMAFIGAGTASATVLCSTTVSPCPEAQRWPVNTVLDFSIPAGASAKLTDTSGETTIDTCTGSTVKGPITNAGSSTATVTGTVEELTWTSCSFPTTTVVKNKLEVHQIAGTSNGTVTADGEFEVTINTVIFGKCIYKVRSGQSLGDVTEGNPPIFHANAIAEKTTTETDTCPVGPATALWTGTYTLTSPSGTTGAVSAS
jgi:hypothetical protein